MAIAARPPATVLDTFFREKPCPKSLQVRMMRGEPASAWWSAVSTNRLQSACSRERSKRLRPTERIWIRPPSRGVPGPWRFRSLPANWLEPDRMMRLFVLGPSFAVKRPILKPCVTRLRMVRCEPLSTWVCRLFSGVLTTDTAEQALARSGGKKGNKGTDAAVAAIEMVNLLRKIERQ